MENVKKALDLKKELDELRPIKKEYEERIMQKFRLDWNYHSNHIEGNTLTHGETKALILHGITAQGKPLQHHIEIEGHDEAIKWITEVVTQERPLTENFIRELHKLILKKQYQIKTESPEGLPTKKTIKIREYKTAPNHVKTATGEMFYFATPEETPAKMYDLIEWYRAKRENKEINPILLAAEFHYRFIVIHPFDDGNGRTARILMNFILMSCGYPPVVIKTEEKEDYYSVLRQADVGLLEPFIEYIALNLNQSLEIMIKGAKGESVEDPDDIDKEIVILKDKLDSKTKPNEAFKAPLYVKRIINSFFKICSLIVKKDSELNEYYLHNALRLKKNNDEMYTNVSREKLKKTLSDWSELNLEWVIFEYAHLCFDHKKTKPFNYISNIQINFEITTYKIQSGLNVIEKHYPEELNENEITLIASDVIRKHKVDIESKVFKA